MKMTDKLNVIQEDWYAQGLNFKCTGCGQCCTGSPGYTWVTEEEIIAIADYLKISVDDFSKKYLRKVKNRFSLLEHSHTYDCVFLKDKKCAVYAARPKQCRTFPWWQKNLKTPEDWKQAAKFCEGINPDAPLVAHQEIKDQFWDSNQNF